MEIYHGTCVCTDSFNELVQQSVCLRNLRFESAELVGKRVIPLFKSLPPCFFRFDVADRALVYLFQFFLYRIDFLEQIAQFGNLAVHFQ